MQDPAASLGAQTLRGLHGSTPNVLGHLAGPHFLAHFHRFTALNRHTILGFRIIWCRPANLGLLAALYKSTWCSHSVHLWVLAPYWLDRYVLPSSTGHEHWPAIKSFGKFTSTSPNQTLQFFMFSLRYIRPWRTCWNYFHDGDDDLITWETRVICASIELGLECLPVLVFQVFNYAFFLTSALERDKQWHATLTMRKHRFYSCF